MRKIQEKRSQNRNGGALDARGFTLAELLIVVAIIGVLVAISIPIFSSQLEKAREATDAANIRSQYAQVMAEAIFDGGDVNGQDLYGAIELKQKQDEWQNTGLKSNLEGGYGQIIGDYPKAGGTAWVEYKYNDGIAVLHYEGGSGSGGTSGGDSGGGSGSGSEQPGGSSGSGSGGAGGGAVSPGGGSGDNTEGNEDQNSTNPSAAYNNIEQYGAAWPDQGISVKVTKGEIISYNGKIYIVSSNRSWDMNQYWYTTPANQPNDFYVINDKTAQTDADLQKPWQGSDKQALVNLSVGDLYQDSENNYYVYIGGSSINVPPSQTSHDWIQVLGKKK